VKSRCFSGDITAGVIKRFGDIVQRKPAKIFMLIGTNDLARGITADSVVKNILLMADYLQQESPATQLYVQSILPVNDVYGKFPTHTKNGEKIKPKVITSSPTSMLFDEKDNGKNRNTVSCYLPITACCTTNIMWIKIVANGHCRIVS